MSAPLKPGWAMTEDQHSLFWRLWAAACAWQKWDTLPSAAREEKRREMLLDLGFSSAKVIGTTADFDRVKRRLEELGGRVHNEAPDAGQRRRILARIGEAISELSEAGYPSHSLDTILRTRFKIVAGIRTIADLPTLELLNLSRTLAARLASWKDWRALVNLLRALALLMASFNAWPPPITRPASCSATGTASASAAHPFAALMPKVCRFKLRPCSLPAECCLQSKN